MFFGVLGLIVTLAVIAGLLPRLERQRALATASQDLESQTPQVGVVAVRAAAGSAQLVLPGSLLALVESPIFARTEGYLHKRLVDIGERVKTGQDLAELETPELDQQIRQARATMEQAQSALREMQANLELSRANLKLAQVTFERIKKIFDEGVVSTQDKDDKEAALAVRNAEVTQSQARINTAQDTVRANEANLRRLQEIKSFARITAPFDGIITARNVDSDIGTLISAGNGPAKEIFRIAQIDVLRIFVNVPQSYVSSIAPGQAAQLRVAERPGQIFPARVKGTTNSLDANSRSMLAVLEVANPQHVLLPGMYAEVTFNASRNEPLMIIPGDTLVLGQDGPRVAVVGADHRVHFRKIQIIRDSGSELEVSSDLRPGDQLVVNPSDEVREDALVEIRK
jgi:RND family efflux transporter MFP subunit